MKEVHLTILRVRLVGYDTSLDSKATFPFHTHMIGYSLCSELKVNSVEKKICPLLRFSLRDNIHSIFHIRIPSAPPNSGLSLNHLPQSTSIRQRPDAVLAANSKTPIHSHIYHKQHDEPLLHKAMHLYLKED